MIDHVIRAAARVPWAIEPEKLDEIVAFLNLRMNGEHVDPAIVAQFAAVDSPQRAQTGTVAVIPVYGVISQRMNLMAAASGGTSTEKLAADIRSAVTDPSISAIVLNFDSPGGSVFGVEELAREIRAARSQKPIVAVGNPMIASAAYWLASQTGEIVATPSSMVGSIGVLAMHVDHSMANETAGIRPTIISAGKYKAEGSSDFPLSDEARAYLQDRADQYYSMFLDAVAAGRGVTAETVKTGYGEGRLLMAGDALKAGMIDRIATLDETVQRLQAPQSRAAVLRRSQGAARSDLTLVTAINVADAPIDPVAANDSPPLQAETNVQEGQMAEEQKTTTVETPPEPTPSPNPEPNPQPQPNPEASVATTDRFAAMEAENRRLAALLAQHSEQLAAVQSENASMKAERLRKTFTDEVRGRSDANDKPWAGEIESNVKYLTKLADTFGEDSEELAFALAQGRAAAAQIRTGDLYRSTGSDRSGRVDAQTRLDQAAEKLVAEGKAKTFEEGLEQAMVEHPDLYQSARSL